ncbi:MAG: hypothetical protein ABI477_12280 [Chryseolinea sp.]
MILCKHQQFVNVYKSNINHVIYANINSNNDLSFKPFRFLFSTHKKDLYDQRGRGSCSHSTLAFTNDFGSIPENETWTFNFNVTHAGVKTMAQPAGYTFHKKKGRDKIEVRYNTDGKPDHAKVLDKP